MLGGPVTTVIPVTDATHVGQARRAVAELGVRAGLDEAEQGNLALVVTEIVTNLARSARQGMLYCRQLGVSMGHSPETEPGGVEVLATDRGPGIANLDVVMRDTGLGTIPQLASDFDLYSLPQTSPNPGTVLMARIWARDAPLTTVDRCVGIVCVPLSGETACGDSWAVCRTPEGRCVTMVADGLGHGQDAAAASIRATRLFAETLSAQPDIRVQDILTMAHETLRATRGAAIAIAGILGSELYYAGVGNIVGTVLANGRTQTLVSQDGIVGLRIRHSKQLKYAWPDHARLIMHSDGVSSRWRLDNYPGLGVRHPSLIAGVLFRDGARLRDDATMMVMST